jgi:hypothetical protein
MDFAVVKDGCSLAKNLTPQNFSTENLKDKTYIQFLPLSRCKLGRDPKSRQDIEFCMKSKNKSKNKSGKTYKYAHI